MNDKLKKNAALAAVIHHANTTFRLWSKRNRGLIASLSNAKEEIDVRVRGMDTKIIGDLIISIIPHSKQTQLLSHITLRLNNRK